MFSKILRTIKSSTKNNIYKNVVFILIHISVSQPFYHHGLLKEFLIGHGPPQF